MSYSLPNFGVNTRSPPSPRRPPPPSLAAPDAGSGCREPPPPSHPNPSGPRAGGEIHTSFSFPRRSSTTATFIPAPTWPGRCPHRQDPKGHPTPIPTACPTSLPRQTATKVADNGARRTPAGPKPRTPNPNLKPRTLTLPAASPRAAILHRLQRLPPLHPPPPLAAALTHLRRGSHDARMEEEALDRWVPPCM
jgi:hypothetical protein